MHADGTAGDERGRDQLDRIRVRYERLLAAGVEIASEHALENVLRRVVESARSVVGARYAALGVLDDDGEMLTAFETSGLTAEERERIGALPRGHGLLGVVIRTGRPLRVPRIGDHPESHGFPPNHPPMDSFLGVPIITPSRVYGNLYLTEKIGADEFSDDDERVAVLLASQAAAAVEHARLFEETSSLLAQVQHMQRQRDQFFAMINHELRNALTGVYGWAEQARRSKSAAVTDRAVQEVYEAAERTITLMNNLLDLSRLDAGRVQTVYRETDVASVVARACAAVRPAAEARHIALIEEGTTPPVACETDGLRLEQIVVNLVANAVRHSAVGDEVVIRTETTGDEVLLHVIDRGRGISQDDQTKIFEPFIRVDPESGLGSGLGLPVSRRLAELLGGRLTVHSDLGRGATFTIALPRRPPMGGTPS